MKKIITRFAPSPTGFLHLGSARTALFAWAFAKHYQQQGQFLLRIEDTDLQRSNQESIDSILKAFEWLGLDYDGHPIYQTQNFVRYQQIAQLLIKHQYAYYCYCSKEELSSERNQQTANKQKAKYSGKCWHNQEFLLQQPPHQQPVIRFRNPQHGSISWLDLVKGQITIDNNELDDFIILRSDRSPTYNFCVAVDDIDMKISHVIRGDDHVNNTPKQINIIKKIETILNQENLIPYYAHLPMILAPNGEKLSKRKDAVDVMLYQQMGILPQSLLNYLARLCWSHGDDEIFSVEQFISWFDLSHISPAAARFDLQKLLWLNGEKIKQASASCLYQEMVNLKQCFNSGQWQLSLNYNKTINIIEFIKCRHDNLLSLAQELDCFYSPQTINDQDLNLYLSKDNVKLVQKFVSVLTELKDNWQLSIIKDFIKNFCQLNQVKMPVLAMPLRLILCGHTKTVSFDLLLYLFGLDSIQNQLASFLKLNNY